ncbi:MAG: hypothetical protein A2004_09435 [Spirochaetes bacterium GWC1_61_12]|nr:MAG: hypothetical protein A2Y37_05305 [Spirochaetes bacterium GWB1_60_80]OHD33244.1 MAG: hypothetical protein A2004_09435 [Spirochaetes bacterium GWC1_61_12]OHD42749.1 MAG: hypothetical protein A2Y35_05685 [Spirochaetes bacterium GWE1_60_18]OHD58601.1 MAG: hypothetical protein A2Y32_04610 [Spirochaetes bacterium GWF1_60_12]HAP44435.1 hypothetical protein [Spirochaetaceae bacterium]
MRGIVKVVEKATGFFNNLLGLSNAFWLDDFIMMRKIRSGDIATELLKPVSFGGLVLAENAGTIAFRLLANFLPALLVSLLYIRILPPSSALNLLLAVASAGLGFLILFGISYLVSLASFWVVNVWSISTIKNVFINVFSGLLIPMWFMPEPVLRVIRWTPLVSIYHFPISLYLGAFESAVVWRGFGLQLFWALIIFSAGAGLWRKAVKRLVVQGG